MNYGQLISAVTEKKNPLYAILRLWSSEDIRAYDYDCTWCCYIDIKPVEGGYILESRCHRGRGRPSDTYYGNDGRIADLPVQDNLYWWNIDKEGEDFEWAEEVFLNRIYRSAKMVAAWSQGRERKALGDERKYRQFRRNIKAGALTTSF